MARTRAFPVRYIDTQADLEDGIKALRRKCKVMRLVHDAAGAPPLRRRAAGFEGLARIVVAQQLSVASANAIWARFEATVVPLAPRQLLRLPDEALRGAGLSRPKVRTLRAVSEAVVGGLDLTGFQHARDEDVHEALTAVSGIGPWTADIFLMFCLGRADAFASGDLALQIAAQHAFGFEARPDHAALAEMAERWRPWRGVAARLLWAYYRTVKAPKSGVPV